jgi:protein subunit release factor A
LVALDLLSLEKFVKKLLGRNDIEEALKRLDTLTMEEARMAISEIRVDVKEVNAVVQRSANIADEEKRSYSEFSALDSRGSFTLTENQLRKELRKWLSPPDPSTNHNIARKAHHKGTASWFFQGSIFEEWKSSPSLLWIHGKRMSLSLPLFHTSLTVIFIAGSGKSVLW